LKRISKGKTMKTKILYDGSNWEYNTSNKELKIALINLISTIYKALAKGKKIEVYLEGSERVWRKFKINEEVFIDAKYRIKQK